MSLKLLNQAELVSELTEAMAASDIAVERYSNFVIRSTAARAQSMIRSGGRSGRVYNREDPDRIIQASAPGEAPANDLGNLADSITFKLFNTSGMVGFVEAQAFYAIDLELGTDKIAPRPFLFPAFREAIATAEGRLKKEFEAQL